MFDWYFAESIDLPNKHMLLVEAVWVMPSVTGCQTFSTPIDKPIPNISDGRRPRFAFAASFNGTKPEEKPITTAKTLLKVYHDYSQNVNAMTNNREIRFREEKQNVLRLTNEFEHFQPNLDNRNPGADPSRVHMPPGSFLEKNTNSVKPKQSPRQLLSKNSYRLAEEK